MGPAVGLQSAPPLRAAGSDPVAERVRRTVDLLAARGYAVTPERLASVLYGGPVRTAQVLEAIAADPALALDQGRVVRGTADRVPVDLGDAVRRQAHHAHDAAAMWPVAERYTRSLLRHCPWVQVVMVGGSLASHGFEHGDDIDFDLVVDDGTKHLSYLVALLATLPVAWRHRREATERTTPLLPKLVCLNVVWERRQAEPFRRDDDRLALELLLCRPLFGQDSLARILAANPPLLAHFPQLATSAEDAAPRPRPSPVGRVLRLLARRRMVRRALDAASYRLVRGLHAWVRWHRRRTPALLEHVRLMEEHKRPYGILERAGGTE